MATIRRAATVSRETIDKDARTFEVIWTTGAAVPRRLYDWANDRVVDMEEVLSLKANAVRMARLASGRAPVLNAHSDWDLSDVIGVVDKASISASEGRATLRLSKREEVDPLWQDIQDGIIANVSVGYDVHRWQIDRQEGKREVWTAVDWEPLELSLVPIGADPGAVVRAADVPPGKPKPRTFTTEFEYRATPATEQPEEKIMDAQNAPGSGNEAEKTDNTVTVTVENNAPDEGAIRTKERTRITEIRKAVRAFGFEEKDADPFIDKGSDIHEVRAALQEKLAAKSTEKRQRPHVQAGGQDEVMTRCAMMQNAIEHRLDKTVKLEDGARQYRGRKLIGIAIDCLEAEGAVTRGLSDPEVYSVAMGLTRSPGMHSTSDFPLILANAVSKRLRQAYEAAPSYWKQFCRQANLPDFKSRYIVALSELSGFNKVLEGGEYKYGKLSEEGTNYKLSTYGEIIAITRQAIINDDIGAFDRLPALYGSAASDNEADIVWALITSNPTMYDGNALFSSAHANLAGSGAAISITTLSAARTAMRKMKNIAGRQRLNVEPAFLVVPPELETLAQQMMMVAPPGINAQTNINVFAGSMKLIVEPRLSDNSTTAWYLIASPSRVDTIEYAYLEGQEGVYTEQRWGFNVDGLEVKAREDFGAALVEWRGFYKNPGA